MEPKFKSSFIPKKDVTVNTRGRKRRTTGKGWLDRIAHVIFVVVLLGWGGLFGYQKYVEASIRETEQELIVVQDNIDNQKVDTFRAFGEQVKNAKAILARHVSVEPLFNFLNTYTIPSMQFAKFSLTLTGAGLMVEATGLAKNFASISLQADTFTETNQLVDVKTSDIAIDPITEEAQFMMTFLMPRNSVLYSELVADSIPPVTEIPETMNAMTATSSATSTTEVPSVSTTSTAQ